MKRVLFLMSLICFTFIGLTSCGSSDDEPVTSSDYVSSPTKSMDSNANRSIREITITSNTDWSASTDASWCTVKEPSTGVAGDSRLKIEIEENTTGADRHANLILKTKTNQQTLIPINQAK